MTQIYFLQIGMALFSSTIGLAAVYGAAKAVFAVRSKVRARVLLESEAQFNQQLLSVRRRLIQFQDIDPVELAALLKMIESKLGSLPDGDRKVISEGLRQSNKVGAERFLKEVVGVDSVANGV